jgi:hypothetical protein
MKTLEQSIKEAESFANRFRSPTMRSYAKQYIAHLFNSEPMPGKPQKLTDSAARIIRQKINEFAKGE